MLKNDEFSNYLENVLVNTEFENKPTLINLLKKYHQFNKTNGIETLIDEYENKINVLQYLILQGNKDNKLPIMLKNYRNFTIKLKKLIN